MGDLGGNLLAYLGAAYLFNDQELFDLGSDSQEVDARIYSFQRYYYFIVIARLRSGGGNPFN